MTMMDLIVIIIAVFGLIIGLFFSAFFIGEFKENEILKGTVAEEHLNKTELVLFSVDNWIPFVFIGLVFATVITAYFIQSHPIFFVISLGLLVFIILITGPLVNIFNAFAGEDVFANVVNNYNISIAMMQNLPTLILIAAMIILVALYGKHGKRSERDEPVY